MEGYVPLTLPAPLWTWRAGGDVRICVMTAFASAERPNRQHHCSNASGLSISAYSFDLILCLKRTGKMICSKNILLPVSPYTKSYHTKRIPGQVMPDFCTFGQEIPLWKRFYYGSVSVKMSGRGQVMAFLAAILCLE